MHGEVVNNCDVFTEYYHCYKTKDNEMGGACSKHGRDEKCKQNVSRKIH
jgi:hypothetical protein